MPNMYDIYHGEQLRASVSRQEDGKKTWQFASEWDRHCFFSDEAITTDIEQAIEIWQKPLEQKDMTLFGFTIRRRKQT
jgi:hypothetical protein